MNDNIQIKGTFRFTTSPAWAQKIMQFALKAGRAEYEAVVSFFTVAGIAHQTIYNNLVVTAGKAILAKGLAQNFAGVDDLKITHQELGTGTTPPAYGDTGLQTPAGSTRKAITSIGYSANVTSITSFWAVGEATGTWKEYGLFIKGTGTSNSGTLWNRVALDQTVASDKALTLDGTITFT